MNIRYESPAIRRSLVLVCGGLVLPAATPGFAQSDATESRGVIKVEVTGSNIKRVEGESGLPVQVITREELINGGVQTAQELLQRISANQSFGGWNEAKGEGSNLVGFTAASLRGLGSQRTLVLLNGRRLAPYALSAGQSVDLSAIPASALEKVEVLKDGASAVYGTDAIGGVINFILRKDFTGVEVNANYFVTEQGGGDNGRINATAGIGDLTRDRYNFFISADYFKQDPLKASQRESTKTAYVPSLGLDLTSGFALPANISQTIPFTDVVYGFPERRNPTIPFPGGATAGSCMPPISFPTERSAFQCRFDYASVIETIPEAEKTNVIGRFTWQIDSQSQLFAEGSYYYGKFTQRVSPTPVSTFTSTNSTEITLSPASPYYPAAYVAGLEGGDPNLPIYVHYRAVELGPRTDQGIVDQWRGIVGLQGTIKGWDYALAVNYTANKETDNFVSGWVYASAFAPLFRSGVINPFGPNTDAVLQQMRATQIAGQANSNRASNYGGDFKVAGNIYELAAGPVALALGLEGRRESLEQMNSDFFATGDVFGLGGEVPSLPTTHRTVWSLFGELNIPVIKSLEINLAARYDHYSDFGSTTNPKITLRWQPNREVLLRAAYGTGFRAPTLSDLFQPPTYGSTGSTQDPIRCPVTQSDYDCNEGFVSQGGGNPLLQPEKSKQVNAGIVVEPISGLSAGVDYYWVKVTNLIQILQSDVIFADYALWGPTRVLRRPATPDDIARGLPGAIDYVIENQINVGTLQTSGVDVDLRWRAPATSVGQFTAGLTGTYVVNYNITGINSALFPSTVGTRGPDGAISRWRHYATLDWTKGPWGATLANTYQSGYNEPCETMTDEDGNVIITDPSGCTIRRVGSYSVWDLQGRYTGFKNLTLTLGIRNILDTSPPISNQQLNFQAGIDPSYGDPRGRMFYGAIRYVFK
jgi:iron complex outermembrane receptor protein